MIFRHEITVKESESELSQKYPRVCKAEWYVILTFPVSKAKSGVII